MLETLLNHDLYDSSHPDYSEEYSSNDRHKKSRFQYRFRERLEQKLSNPREPKEYLTAISENNQRLRTFFNDEGTFDMDSYVSSDVFQEKQELKRQKLRTKIVRDINNDINKQAAEIVSEIKITRYALEKAQYVATRVSQLSDNVGKGQHYEIGMYATDDSLIGREPDITIRDVIIGHDQVIQSDHCNITPQGKMKSFKDINSHGKRIVGWPHSHGEFDIYFSEEDNQTMSNHLESWSISKPVQIPGFDLTNSINFFAAFVVNDRNDEPAYGIMINKPRFYYEDKQLKSTTDELFFQRVPNRDFSETTWPIPTVVGDNNKLSDKEKSELDRQIIDRVIFSDETRLSDYYKENDIPLYEKPLKRKTSAETPKETRKPDAVKTQIKQERRQHGNSSYLDLDSRLQDLETRYSSLEIQVEELQKKVKNYEIFGINHANYSDSITSYYTNLINSDNKAEGLIGRVSEILAGDYHDNNKRIWTWDDRIKAILDIYQDNKTLFSKLDKVLVGRLIEILDKNSYLKRRHNDKLEKIIQLLM